MTYFNIDPNNLWALNQLYHKRLKCLQKEIRLLMKEENVTHSHVVRFFQIEDEVTNILDEALPLLTSLQRGI